VSLWAPVQEAVVKLWLDDVRPAPDGWVHVYTAPEAICYFAQGNVEEASLDHDLGPSDAGTGYDVLLWVEKAMAAFAWYGPMPKIHVHSANPVGRNNMNAAIESIHRLYGELRRGDVANTNG
jgi:hypothetical protein